MATPFHVEIVTPERVLYSGDAEEVSMRTEEGEIAFLAHHEDLIGAADITVVRITGAAGDGPSAPASSGQGAGSGDGAGGLRVAVHGGFVHVDQDANSVTILAGVAELASEIDVARARRALEAAESAVGSQPPSSSADQESTGEHEGARRSSVLLAPDSPEAAAKRARVRLEAAGASPSS